MVQTVADTKTVPDLPAAAPDDLPTGLQRWLISLCAIGGTWIYGFIWNAVGVALPQMKGSFAATNDQITWVMIAFVVGSAIMTASIGFVSARLGRKTTFLFALVSFTASLIGCGFSTTLEGEVFWRFMQGFGGAPLLALSQVIMVNAYPPERYQQATSIWAIGFVTGNLLAPVLGGALVEHYGWPWIYFANVPISLLILFLAWHVVPDTPRQEKTLDWLGFLTLILGVAFLQLFLARGERLDWFDSKEVQVEAIISVVLLYMFVAHTLTAKRPFLDRGLFRDRNFMLGQLFIFLVGAVIYLPLLLLPLMLQQVAGYPAIETGNLLFARGIGSVIGLIAMSRLRGRADPRPLIFFGITMTIIPAWNMAHWSADIQPLSVMLNNAVQGVGTSFIWAPLNTLCLSKLDKRLQDQGFSLFYLNYDIGNAIGTSVIITLHARHSQINHAQLAENINPFNGTVQSGSFPQSWSPDTLGGLAKLNDEISRQAAMIAYNNSFMLIALSIGLLIPLILLFRVKKE
ncbi:MAG: DHA2 family efflux MFS transporter permease subunit [Hyphomicrobiaceae bacterium]